MSEAHLDEGVHDAAGERAIGVVDDEAFLIAAQDADASAVFRDADQLGDGAFGFRHVLEHRDAGDDVELRVVEGQVESVAGAEVDVGCKLGGDGA